MDNFKIICDSLADIDETFAKENGIIVLPTFYYFSENEVYENENKLSHEEFYKRLKTERAYSSCINVAEAEELFENILNNGDKLIYLSFSSKCSTCNQVANILKADLDPNGDKIYVYDTELGTYPITFMVEDILSMQKEGKNLKDIYDIMIKNKHKYSIFFTTNELDYFVRGGRLSKTAGTLGNMLNIKPVITFKDGKVSIEEKCRGQKKVYQRIIDLVKEKNIDMSRLVINYGFGTECLDKFIPMFKEAFGENIKYKLCQIHPSIGTHLGPSAIGISFIEQ